MRFAFVLFSFFLGLSARANLVEVELSGMTCAICTEAIERELLATQKVERLTVSFSEKKARFYDKKFTPDPTTKIKEKALSDYEIRSAIKRAGFDVVRIIHKK